MAVAIDVAVGKESRYLHRVGSPCREDDRVQYVYCPAADQ